MGYELNAQDRVTVNQMLRMLRNIRGPNVVYDPGGGGIFIGDGSTGSGNSKNNEFVLARLVAKDSTDCWKWSWQQISRKQDGSYTDARLSGTIADNPAVEINSNINCQENDIVMLFTLPITKTAGGTGVVMVFASESYGLPQYAGQQLGGPSANQAAWVYPTLHAIVPG